MGKKYLITGVCGFVSEYFVEYLNATEPCVDILGLDIALECTFCAKNLRYKEVDLLNKTALREVLDNFKPDYIVHLASISSVGTSWKKPVESFQNNTNIFLNLVEAVRELKLSSRVLSVGSSEEYGDYPKDKMPLKEEYELHPTSPYAVARVSQELISKLYAKSFNVDVVMTRSFNHIGPRQKDIFVVPSFVKQLVEIAKHSKMGKINVGNTEVTRDFLDVRDVVRGYYAILQKGKTGEVYNVCSSTGVKLKDIIYKVADILNIEVELSVDPLRVRPAELLFIVGDNSKIKPLWTPQIPLEKTLLEMVEYWKKEVV